jgi:hypothetical protein
MYSHINLVTFVTDVDPGNNDSSRILEPGGSVADSRRSATEEAVGAGEASDVPEYHYASNNEVSAATSYFHTPTTNFCTPRGHESPLLDTNQYDSDPLEKALVSYLLRHFKQGPGQWCVSEIRNSIKFGANDDQGWIFLIQHLTSLQECLSLRQQKPY